MRISENSIVSIDYVIKTHDGCLTESTEKNAPFEFFNSGGNLLPAVEAALMGREQGEKIDLILPPEKAFGQVDENLKKLIPLKDLQGEGDPLQEGEYIGLDGDQHLSWLVEAIRDEQVHLDANSPWAGKTLHISIQIAGVRPATHAELRNRRVLTEETGSCGLIVIADSNYNLT